jgi:hypothetical protein
VLSDLRPNDLRKSIAADAKKLWGFMDIKAMIAAVRAVLADTVSEERVYTLTQDWLLTLRDEYKLQPGQFQEDDIVFLKNVRDLGSRLRRFINLQEELSGPIGLKDHNEAMRELKAMRKEFEGFAVARRVEKEIRQLQARRCEVLEYEQLRKNSRRTNQMIDLEKAVERCPNDTRHRLLIKGDERGYFWGCSAFPDCWYSRRLTPAEVRQLAS